MGTPLAMRGRDPDAEGVELAPEQERRHLAVDARRRGDDDLLDAFLAGCPARMTGQEVLGPDALER